MAWRSNKPNLGFPSPAPPRQRIFQCPPAVSACRAWRSGGSEVHRATDMCGHASASDSSGTDAARLPGALCWGKLHRPSCLLLLALLCSLAAARQSVPVCCRQKTCPCHVYDLLHGPGKHAAGILTMGKRKSGSRAFQSQLYDLLHGPGKHAAGILTMGKRKSGSRAFQSQLYDLLHGPGKHAAGILTMGKRKSGSRAFQSQLYDLLHGPGKHAAGILTVGKRAELAPEQPAPACRAASPGPSGPDTLLPPATCATKSDPTNTRECLGQLGKDSAKGQCGGAARSFS
nr:orexin isoform X1 [Caretta caretta]